MKPIIKGHVGGFSIENDGGTPVVYGRCPIRKLQRGDPKIIVDFIPKACPRFNGIIAAPAGRWLAQKSLTPITATTLE